MRAHWFRANDGAVLPHRRGYDDDDDEFCDYDNDDDDDGVLLFSGTWEG
jgi:hypothetical protein